MNYLKRPFMIEDTYSGTKVVVSTFRHYVKLTPFLKDMAREFQRDGISYSLGDFLVRKHEAFELI